ncbi:hypothetical protein [Desulfofustis limnaeus]|uniref:Uncharacterized protein n=1 Tax=Desulfofustis limnaeus TaxID=2740163 RepID=A0ABN6M2C9_9BACT|nr:hypothetical protein [Desulfofustis limnaeus]BDD87020.1 hypothetical protein DPPLL_13850 [Desulfofustis limnaeus]
MVDDNLLKELNPWKEIPVSAPFVLPHDKMHVDRYNEQLSISNESYLHSELYPEQYAGKFGAEIVLLGKCPGYSPDDASFHSGNTYKKLWKGNVSQSIEDYPLFLLHHELKNAPCFNWWYKKLKSLIEYSSLRIVAKKILEIQLFPYHCKKLRLNKSSKTIPSRGFAGKLVTYAVQRNALIIIMESEKLWKEHVPELHKYPNVFTVNSTRSGAVSPGNLPDGVFDIRAP